MPGFWFHLYLKITIEFIRKNIRFHQNMFYENCWIIKFSQAISMGTLFVLAFFCKRRLVARREERKVGGRQDKKRATWALGVEGCSGYRVGWRSLRVDASMRFFPITSSSWSLTARKKALKKYAYVFCPKGYVHFQGGGGGTSTPEFVFFGDVFFLRNSRHILRVQPLVFSIHHGERFLWWIYRYIYM